MKTIKPDFSDKKTLEKYSSTFTLSDMEIFIFPELFYPIVIANIMSPVIWKWRDDSWFKNIQTKSFTYKINRIKQFIMDHYVFNLDLETWGLTTKEIEIDRFRDFFDIKVLQQSNALFGYEGDKFYFDIDIRKHFGLDKYTTDVIPYWKTETVEAMTAFRFKDGFDRGAGECVSLSALYAAALFIIGRIPLKNIFLIATPLHSQNFIDIHEGVLTNNRRIVTKNMWFNGTSLSAKARRALENEKVTLVSHISGYIHMIYPKATIDPLAYQEFSESLKKYLYTTISPAIFINFLRYDMNFKKCFQYVHTIHGHEHYIALEKVFEYEHGSKNNFSEQSRLALLNEIETEEFNLSPLDGRMFLNEIEKFLTEKKNLNLEEFKDHFLKHASEVNCKSHKNILQMFEEMKKFISVQPRLPQTKKEFISENTLNIDTENTREEIIRHVFENADHNEIAQLALYTYRQMDMIDWSPFIKSAIERNPVSLEGLKDKSIEDVYQILSAMPNESIYDSQRLAQPDEVWNFNQGDGVEKSILLANFLVNKSNATNLTLIVDNNDVILQNLHHKYHFKSQKGLSKNVRIK